MAHTKEESNPPLNKYPIGASDINLFSTAFSSFVFNFPAIVSKSSSTIVLGSLKSL